ncbi:hypothetical protein ACEWY4_005249 [Coilia grayii]|uniref:Mitochondrial antiviral-signaling protein n=1 Tax=Coilia grayii TaxID=363190 RepID=A0ABD1KI03_9TELE
MPYASDKLYKDYIRKNMARFATQVKVREILPHLSCLTQSDREEVEVKRETMGNYNAMQLLLDNLKRRENWPEEFVRALEECEHTTLAREMRDTYEALKQPKNSVPQAAGTSSTPATVITADVHTPLPAASVPVHPPAPASSPSDPAEPASASTSPPSSPAKATLPPSSSSSTSEPPSPPKMAPEAGVAPDDASSRPAPPPSEAAEAASPPSTAATETAAVRPENTVAVVNEVEVTQTEEDQAPEVSASTEPDIPDGPVPDVPPEKMPECSTQPLDPQPPAEEPAPEPPQPMTVPVQETSQPSRTVMHEPEETSDPSMQQVSTQEQQQPTAPSEKDEVKLPPPDSQTTTPPSPTPTPAPTPAPAPAPTPSPAPSPAALSPTPPVSAPVVAMIHQPPPSLVDSEEEEFFTKPGVLQSVTEGGACSQEPATESQPPEPCSLTSDDLEMSTETADVASEVNLASSQEPARDSQPPKPCSLTSDDLKMSTEAAEVNLASSQESATDSQPPEPCSLTSDDLKISTENADVASEENAGSALVSSAANTDVSPEPVLQPDPAQSLTEAAHSQEPVTVKENGSPPHQPNGLSDDQAPTSHHILTEEHYESVCSSSFSSQEQSTLVHVVQVSTDPSIQNQDAQAQGMMGNAGSSETAMVNHSDVQSEASLTEQQLATNHQSLTASILGNEVYLTQVKEEASGTEDTSSPKTEVVLVRRESGAQAEDDQHEEEGVKVGREEQGESLLAGVLPVLQSNPLIPAAAAVGVCALVFAWKLRN